MTHNISLFLFLGILPAAGTVLVWDLQVSTNTWSNVESPEIFANAQFPGQLSLDQSLVPEMGQQTIANPSQSTLFSMILEIAGTTYTQESDPAAGFPTFHFNNGSLVGLDYLIPLDRTIFDEGSFLQLYPDGSMTYSPDGVGEYEGTYQTSPNPIPEPEIPVLALSTLLLTLSKRNR